MKNEEVTNPLSNRFVARNRPHLLPWSTAGTMRRPWRGRTARLRLTAGRWVAGRGRGRKREPADRDETTEDAAWWQTGTSRDWRIET
jgi:hypothetical protein